MILDCGSPQPLWGRDSPTKAPEGRRTPRRYRAISRQTIHAPVVHPKMILAAAVFPGSSADFQVCCIAGFQTRKRCDSQRLADLEVGDTAGLETCATSWRLVPVGNPPAYPDPAPGRGRPRNSGRCERKFVSKNLSKFRLGTLSVP